MIDMQRHEKVKALIHGTNGKISKAWFVKKDGTVRPMTFRTKVTKGVTGKGRNFNPDEKGLVGVFDMTNARHGDDPDDRSFRFINSQSVFALKISGQMIRIADVPAGYELPE